MSSESVVLVVDDDPDVRKVVSELLRPDYGVLEASGGAEAIRLTRSGRPKLMILDFSMPQMNGLDVLKAARQIDSRLPILMLTSRREMELAKEALDSGAVEFMTKPFEPTRLRAEVARLLESRPGEREFDGPPWRTTG